MSGSITVPLTDRECRVLAELSNELDLPQDRVMVMALRVYRKHLHPVADLAMVKSYDDLCETCGIGFYLPSGKCDHCDSVCEVHRFNGERG